MNFWFFGRSSFTAASRARIPAKPVGVDDSPAPAEDVPSMGTVSTPALLVGGSGTAGVPVGGVFAVVVGGTAAAATAAGGTAAATARAFQLMRCASPSEIGRASCRERV